MERYKVINLWKSEDLNLLVEYSKEVAKGQKENALRPFIMEGIHH